MSLATSTPACGVYGAVAGGFAAPYFGPVSIMGGAKVGTYIALAAGATKNNDIEWTTTKKVMAVANLVFMVYSLT